MSFFRDIGSGFRSIGSWGQHAVEDTADWTANLFLGNMLKKPVEMIGDLLSRPVIFIAVVVVGGIAVMTFLDKKTK